MKKFVAVGLVGNPNTGKSSFLNALVGSELSVVTAKPQTTRQRIEGLLTVGDLQVLLFDAPGFVEEKKGLFAKMAKEAKTTMKDADCLLAFAAVDESSPQQVEQTLQTVQASRKPWSVVVTKTDLKKYALRKDRIRLRAQQSGAENIFEFSRLKQKALQPFFEYFAKHAEPVEEFPYDADIISPANVRDLVPSYVQEQLFSQLGGEIPFGCNVVIRQFTESPKLIRIEADIWVSRESHKRIVIGQKAEKLKSIGTKARMRIEKFLGQKVYLGLNVTVKEKWDLRE